MSNEPKDEQPWALFAEVPPAAPVPYRRKAKAAGPALAPRERRLSFLLFLTLPVPVGGSEDAAWCWFRLVEALGEPRDRDGLTARQLATREGIDQVRYLADTLDRLVDAGDLIATRKGGGPARYRSQPLHKSLPRHLAAELARGAWDDAPAWEALGLAALAYEDDPRQAQWTALKTALVALTDGLPGWPEAVRAEARAGAERWAGPVAGVQPPSHVAVDDEWARLRIEADRLKDENARLQARLAAKDGDEAAQRKRLQRRVEALEAQNAELMREVSDLQEQLEGLEDDLGALEPQTVGPELRAFLEGKGRGALPEYVPDDEVERLRKLVIATRAPLPRQLMLAERLGDIYRTPHRFQRLTSMSFQTASHAFETLHRVAVYKYRIGYGLLKKVPYVVDIGPRENFYGRFIGKL